MASCEDTAERMDRLLDVSLGSDDMGALLSEVRRERSRYRGIRAACTASLALNEIVVLMFMDRMQEADSVQRDFRQTYFDSIPAEEKAHYHLTRGYVLAVLGKTQASTLEYVEAAALARELPPDRAAEALLYAALTFNEVDDAPRARMYLRQADSTARANLDAEGVRAMLGEIELEHAIVLQQEAAAASDPRELQELAREAAYRALTLITDSDCAVS